MFRITLLVSSAAVALCAVQDAPADDAAADDPAPVSAYAPIDPLAASIVAYHDSVRKLLENGDDFADSQERVVKEANVLLALARAMTHHDADHELKSRAPALAAAAAALADATEYDEARDVLARLEATDGSNAGEDVAADDAADPVLGQLMNEAALLFGGLRRSSQGRRLVQRRDDNIEKATTVAVIAQTAAANSDYCEDDAQIAVWRRWAHAMRDAAAELAGAARAGDADAAATAFEQLDTSCVECHREFNVEE